MKIKSYRRPIKKTAALFAITDIVLNIFIFFFITFNLAGTLKTEQESHITDIGVPHEAPAPPKGPPETKTPLEVLIRGVHPTSGGLLLQVRDSSGHLKRIKLEKLTEEINKSSLIEKAEDKIPSVIITTRQDIIYDYVVKVLDAVKDSKYEKIALIPVEDFKREIQ